MLGYNLKLLRKYHQINQQELADTLGLSRTTLGDYERSHTEPNLETLIKISKHFDISIDRLIKTKLNPSTIEIKDSENLKILSITVDKTNRSNIELVDTKAVAGYLDAFSDPEFIKDLPKLYFPNIPTGTYRAFELKGDSMLPMEEGTIVICSYLENLTHIKNNKTYVIISRENGVVYKRVQCNNENHKLTLISDNETYKPYEIDFRDIEEIWQYYAHLSFTDTYHTFNNELIVRLTDINRKVSDIHEQIVN